MTDRRTITDKKGKIISPSLSGEQSITNSTTKLLASGETFTGGFEHSDHPNVGVSMKSNVSGTLFFDFSIDGINTDTFPPNGFVVTAGITEFHTAVKLPRYFRVRFVMDAGTQTEFRLATYFGSNFFPSSTPVNLSIADDVDSTITRVANDHKLDLARGFIGGHAVLHKFGENPDISASTTEDINFNGSIHFPTVATTVRVKAGNAADTADGNGARTVRVIGLDENFDDAEEDLILAGESASGSTTTTFIRVFRAYVLTVGVYGAANTAAVIIEDTAGDNDFVTIAIATGQTEDSAFCVPAGKTAYLTRVSAEVDANKAVDVKMWQRQDADDIVAPFTAKRIVIDFPQLIGQDGETFDSYIMFPAMTDLWWTGTNGSGNAAAVEVDYDLVLVDD